MLLVSSWTVRLFSKKIPIDKSWDVISEMWYIRYRHTVYGQPLLVKTGIMMVPSPVT